MSFPTGGQVDWNHDRASDPLTAGVKVLFYTTTHVLSPPCGECGEGWWLASPLSHFSADRYLCGVFFCVCASELCAFIFVMRAFCSVTWFNIPLLVTVDTHALTERSRPAFTFRSGCSSVCPYTTAVMHEHHGYLFINTDSAASKSFPRI